MANDRFEVPSIQQRFRPGTKISEVINRLVCGQCRRHPSFVRLDGPPGSRFSTILRGPLLR